MIKIIISLSFVFLFPALALQGPQSKNSEDTLSSEKICSEKGLISEGIPLQWSQLVRQKALLVARQSYFTVHSQANEVLAQGEQSFLKGSMKSTTKVCQRNLAESRYVMSAPTLLDFTKEEKVGHKLWNFQMLHKDEKIQVQNLPSLRPSVVALDAFQTAHKITQIDHYTIRVEYLSVEGSIKKSLIVDYDLVYKI